MPLGTLVQFMLPRWFLLPLAHLAGILSCRFDHWRRADLTENCRHILGPDASPARVRATVRRTFIHLAVNYLDLLCVPVLKRRIARLVTADTGPLDRVLDQGHGAIMVTAHIGNWDLAGVYLTTLGYPLSAVTEPIPAGWSRTFNRYRSVAGMETIPLTDRAAMARALRRNRVFTLVADRDLTRNGIRCPAFDAHRYFPKGPAAYSLKYDVPIVIGHMLFDYRPGRPPYHARMDPPLEYEPTGDRQQDIEDLTLMIARRLNELIGQHPDQWLVFRADWT